MRFSYKLSDAIHILAFLSIYENDDLSSQRIADSIGSNASVVRNLMSDLRTASLIITRQGTASPQLAQNIADISVYDVYMAITMDHNLLHIDPKTNPDCIVGANIQSTLDVIYSDIETTAHDEMKKITIKSIVDDILAQHNANI